MPEPTLNGSTATYPSAYGKGIDLVVTATPTGFRQQIVIRQRPAEPVTFRIPVDLPKGVSFGKNAKGQPTLKNQDGKHNLDIRPAALLDAKAADANADLGAVRVGRAQVSLDGSSLVYSPDAAFLADPATTFPVTMAAVDDDWYECTLGGDPCPPGDPMDTYINDVDLTDSWDMHYRDQMWVGKSYASGIAKRWRAYIQFPLPKATDPFWGSNIQNADLELWNYLSNDCGEFVGSGITARRVTSDWDHLTLAWGDQPSVTNVGADTEYGAYSPDCAGSMNYEHDLIHSVDTIVQDWADGETNYGFQLRAGDESELRNWRRYRSREQTSGYPAHGPRLTVDFEPKVKPARAVVILAPGEPTPRTAEELEAFAAQGRLQATVPSPEPITPAAMQAELANAVDDSVTSADELQSPLPPPVDGVAARWSFTEGTGSTAADSSGSGHDAAVGDGATWTPGVTNSALTNTGAGDSAGETTAIQSLAPALRSAARRAVAAGKPVEVVEATTEMSVTYAQPDGTRFTTEAHAKPVRVKRDGTWIPIDPTLVEQAGKLKPKAMAQGAVVEISNGGEDAFVKMKVDGHSYALRWPTPLPKPTVKGSVATYTDAAGVGADLVVTALSTGFRYEVVLRQRPSKPLELRIGVDDEGLTLTEGKGGRLLLKGKGKKLVAAGTRPIVSDGSAKGPLAKRAEAGTDVVTKDGRTDLVVKLDQAFLADAGTTYPVRVAAAVTLPVGADVDVSTLDVDSPAYPSGPNLLAGTMTGGMKIRTHLKFDTTGLQGSTVTDAKLSMNTIDSHNCGTALTNGIQVARLTSAWDPDNLYWATKPAFTTEDASTNFKGVNSDCATWPDSMDWNVTGITQDWAAGAANHGLVLKSPGEANINNYRVFTSSEDTDFNQPPTLTITTSGPASQPAVSAPAITPAQTVDGVTVTGSLTPQLAATVADPAGGNLTGQFEVEHDPAAPGQGTGQIWTGASQTVTSGGQATVSVPAGKLADGWKIRWRARAANAAASTTSAWSEWQTATVDVPNPSVGPFGVTPSQVVDGQTVTSSLTPTLHTMVSDPAGQPVRAEFDVEHDPASAGQGTGQIWAGGVDNVASGTQAALTVPAGKLTDGWNVRWRVRAINSATTVSSPWSGWQSLSVDVPPPASEPAIGALQISPSEQVNGTTIVTTLTPTLRAEVGNPIGGTLRAEFVVEHDPEATEQGSGPIWDGAVDNVASGAQATVNVPAGVLTDGWKVRWRARAVAGETSSPWSEWHSATVAVPKPAVADLVLTPSTVIDGQTITNVLSPTLKATVTGPAGQTVRAEFEVEHDPDTTGQGTGQIWAGSVDGLASGTQASITVPHGELSDGWTIRWRARAIAGEVPSGWAAWHYVTLDLTQAGPGPMARTAGPVLRTDQSFTVAAWVRWDDQNGAYTIVGQNGVNTAPFRLGNDPEDGLTFSLTSSDAADARSEGVVSGVKAPANSWFHIAAVYDKQSSTATLYLNGNTIGLPVLDESQEDTEVSASAPISFPTWNSTGPLTLGTSMNGTLDEVWAYDRALSHSEIAELVDGSSSEEFAPLAGQGDRRSTTAMAAPQPMTYDRVDPEECWKKFEDNDRYKATWRKNRFSGCQVHSIKFAGDGADTGQFYLMLVASTFNGPDGVPSGGTSRDMYFDVYVNEFRFTDYDFLDANYTLGLSPARGQTACRHITSWNGSAQHNNITKEGDELRALSNPIDDKWPKLATWRFRAAPGDTSGADLISNCNFSPWIKTDSDEWADPIKFEWGHGATPQQFTIRCDSATYISKQFPGGCVMPAAASIKWELGAGYDEAYIHYWKACYDKGDTYPKRPDKIIKGCATSANENPGAQNYLHRIGQPEIDRNRGRATTRCRSLWPNYGTPVPPMVHMECDEFPPASAVERTPAGDKARNLSVCAMPGTAAGPNGKAGKAMTRFYNRDRLLYKDDPWFSRFASKLLPYPATPSNPSMDSNCWKPAVGGYTKWP
ncbi:DNRLRE domain-containing protein [Nonomuraea sp. NPDC003201]